MILGLTSLPCRQVFDRVALAVLVHFVMLATAASAQTTVVMARVAVKDAATYRFAEVFHEFDRWVFPDVGYVDFGSDDYREFFAGVGRTLLRSTRATIVSEMYFVQSAGEASGSARYLMPWVLAIYRPAERLRGETVYFPYVPLNDAAYVQHVLDRSKLEYTFEHFRAGGGYSAYHNEAIGWQHQPFASVTFTPPRVGDIELWLQRAGGGVQFQVRYLRAFK